MDDPLQSRERTCFQTGGAYTDEANLRSDVAICYGIDPGLPARIATWRERGYRIHVMTGVSWGQYQDYLYGRFDGENHEDQAQTDRAGNKISHGGDVYYMCPGETYGEFLCVGVKRALEAGAEAIHLEEPEFWVRGGYSEGFKREWQAYYKEPWQAPHSSPDAQWRASKLKYTLYRRALQQVFSFIQDWSKEHGKRVRCYVPTHSLINYAHWRIVSPESSLARLEGCDGYIAQVWTGTARTATMYRGRRKERTFEAAFLEYGAMQNLVRATNRTVWYLNDPVEDNPGYDWADYKVNWESTLTASLLQPDVWQYEVAPWPERVFSGKYPSKTDRNVREAIPAGYATELQTVFSALNDMAQKRNRWECGTQGIGVTVSDTLMFQRGEPKPSDQHLSNFYGLAMPLVKRGIPAEPIQIENVTIPGCLDRLRLMVLSYHGQKPMAPEVHPAIADWVRKGGALVVWDDDSDAFNAVREWWNSDGKAYATPRLHLFEALGLPADAAEGAHRVGKGVVVYRAANPSAPAYAATGDADVVAAVRKAASAVRLRWRETNHLVLRRGPYVVAAGLDETIEGAPRTLEGRLVDLFDPQLAMRRKVTLKPGSRHLLYDLDASAGTGLKLVAAGCKALPEKVGLKGGSWLVEGIVKTNGIILLRCPSQPASVALGSDAAEWRYDARERLLWVTFANTARPRRLQVEL